MEPQSTPNAPLVDSSNVVTPESNHENPLAPSSSQRRNFSKPDYLYCCGRVRLETIMQVITFLVFFAFICSICEVIGGFIAFYASIGGRFLMVFAMVLLLKSLQLFNQGVFTDKTYPKARSELKLACYLMMASNYLWGAKYIIDRYYYERQVFAFCATIQILLTIIGVLSNSWHLELAEQELIE